MAAVLHLGALLPAAIGLCCLAADRGRARVAELVAAGVMMLAMTDAAATGIVAPVWWAAVLVVGALVLAALRGRARGRAMVGVGGPGRAAAERLPMIVHTASGMIVMALLLVCMGQGATLPDVGAGGISHAHGAGGALVSLWIVSATFLYAAASALLARRTSARLERIQYVAMAVSVSVMAGAALV